MPVEWGLLLFLALGAALAEETPSGTDVSPSMELLEFLGGFETPEGEWVDPLMLAKEREQEPQEAVNEDD